MGRKSSAVSILRNITNKFDVSCKIEDRRQLELCCFDLESLRAAARQEVPRVEFCVDYQAGGLWPGTELIREARAIFPGILSVMLRPRPGGFRYSELEWGVMTNQARESLAQGANELTFGALDENGKLPIGRILLFFAELDQSVDCTFHRAFDELTEPAEAIDTLKRIGFLRVLTSGGERRAVEAAESLGHWQRLAGEEMDIVAAGSVRSADVPLLRNAGVRAFHSAASDSTDGRVNEHLLQDLIAAIHE